MSVPRHLPINDDQVHPKRPPVLPNFKALCSCLHRAHFRLNPRLFGDVLTGSSNAAREARMHARTMSLLCRLSEAEGGKVMTDVDCVPFEVQPAVECLVDSNGAFCGTRFWNIYNSHDAYRRISPHTENIWNDQMPDPEDKSYAAKELREKIKRAREQEYEEYTTTMARRSGAVGIAPDSESFRLPHEDLGGMEDFLATMEIVNHDDCRSDTTLGRKGFSGKSHLKPNIQLNYLAMNKRVKGMPICELQRDAKNYTDAAGRFRPPIPSLFFFIKPKQFRGTSIFRTVFPWITRKIYNMQVQIAKPLTWTPPDRSGFRLALKEEMDADAAEVEAAAAQREQVRNAEAGTHMETLPDSEHGNAGTVCVRAPSDGWAGAVLSGIPNQAEGTLVDVGSSRTPQYGGADALNSMGTNFATYDTTNDKSLFDAESFSALRPHNLRYLGLKRAKWTKSINKLERAIENAEPGNDRDEAIKRLRRKQQAISREYMGARADLLSTFGQAWASTADESLGLKRIVKWMDEACTNHTSVKYGAMSSPNYRWSDNLSDFGDFAFRRFFYDPETHMLCVDAHEKLALCRIAAFHSAWWQLKMHINVLLTGVQASSKSWVILVLQLLLIKGTYHSPTFGTAKSRTVRDNHDGMTGLQEEINPSLLGIENDTRNAGAGRPTGAVTDTEALFKAQLTNLYVETVEPDMENGRIKRVTVHKCRHAFIAAMNAGVHRMSGSLFSRFINLVMMPVRRKNKSVADVSGVEFQDTTHGKRVITRNHRAHALSTLHHKFEHAGISTSTEMLVASVGLRKFTQTLVSLGVSEGKNTRHIERVTEVVRQLTVEWADHCVFDSLELDIAVRGTFSIEKMLHAEMFNVATTDATIFAIGLCAQQWASPIAGIVQRRILNNLFGKHRTLAPKADDPDGDYVRFRFASRDKLYSMLTGDSGDYTGEYSEQDIASVLMRFEKLLVDANIVSDNVREEFLSQAHAKQARTNAFVTEELKADLKRSNTELRKNKAEVKKIKLTKEEIDGKIQELTEATEPLIGLEADLDDAKRVRADARVGGDEEAYAEAKHAVKLLKKQMEPMAQASEVLEAYRKDRAELLRLKAKITLETRRSNELTDVLAVRAQAEKDIKSFSRAFVKARNAVQEAKTLFDNTNRSEHKKALDAARTKEADKHRHLEAARKAAQSVAGNVRPQGDPDDVARREEQAQSDSVRVNNPPSIDRPASSAARAAVENKIPAIVFSDTHIDVAIAFLIRDADEDISAEGYQIRDVIKDAVKIAFEHKHTREGIYLLGRSGADPDYPYIPDYVHLKAKPNVTLTYKNPETLSNDLAKQLDPLERQDSEDTEVHAKGVIEIITEQEADADEFEVNDDLDDIAFRYHCEKIFLPLDEDTLAYLPSKMAEINELRRPHSKRRAALVARGQSVPPVFDFWEDEAFNAKGREFPKDYVQAATVTNKRRVPLRKPGKRAWDVDPDMDIVSIVSKRRTLETPTALKSVISPESLSASTEGGQSDDELHTILDNVQLSDEEGEEGEEDEDDDMEDDTNDLFHMEQDVDCNIHD
jgi:hypothetical protein